MSTQNNLLTSYTTAFEQTFKNTLSHGDYYSSVVSKYDSSDNIAEFYKKYRAIISVTSNQSVRINKDVSNFAHAYTTYCILKRQSKEKSMYFM